MLKEGRIASLLYRIRRWRRVGGGSSGEPPVGRRNAARQRRQGPVREHGPARSGSPASLVHRRGLHRNWFNGDVNRGSGPEPPRRRGNHTGGGDRPRSRGGGVLVEHEPAQCRIQGYRGYGNAGCDGAGEEGLDDGKMAAGGLQPQIYAPLQTGGWLSTSQQTQCLIDFRTYAHFRLPSCSSKAASACRARYSRERMVDSVVLRTRAISTVDSSFTAESSKTSRSLVGRVSMRRRIRA